MMPVDSIPQGHVSYVEALRTATPRIRIRVAAALLGLLSAAVLKAGLETATGQSANPASHGGGSENRFDHEHVSWTALLSQYVANGVVDYHGLADRGQPALDAYLNELAAGAPHQSAWSRQQRLAYWVNAYNAFTIRLILEHYPVRSIRSIGFLPLAAFRKRFIPLGAAGTSISLNALENDILRKQFQDPRVHVAIVCASKSCPALRSEAYRSSIIDQQLDDAARAFLGDSSKNRWDATSRTLYLSSIFKWFRNDFERHSKTLAAFVGRYLPSIDGTALDDGPVRVVFLDYDWSLNGR